MKNGKKRPKGKSAPAVQLSSEEASLVSSLLKEIDRTEPSVFLKRIPSANVAKALIEQLPATNGATVPVLLELQRAFSEKAVQKAVKKAVFRFRKKGVSISPRSPNEAKGPLFRPAEREEPIAALSAIDGKGNRAVFLAIPGRPSGYAVGMGVLNDELGMIQFRGSRCGKKRMKEIHAAFSERVGTMVAATLSHAATILEQAYTGALDKSGAAQSDYLELRPLILKDAVLLERSVIHELIPEDEIPPGGLTQGQLETLFGHRLFASWIIPPEDIEPLLRSFEKIEESPIVLTDAQALQRSRDAKEDWVAGHYPGPARLVLRQRLEEMAYVFHKLHEKDIARLSLAAARGLDRERDLLGTDPVLMFLVDRSLNFYQQASRKADAEPLRVKPVSSGLILP